MELMLAGRPHRKLVLLMAHKRLPHSKVCKVCKSAQRLRVVIDAGLSWASCFAQRA